jgi:heme exporter protein A
VLFRGVQLDLGPGEALHLAGANGIGKSSLIRILAGLMRPLCRHGGARRGHCADGRAAGARWAPAAGPRWRSGTRSTARHRARRSVRLADLADVPVRYLSTGQKKRAALARLAASGAPIWLLDEPLNGSTPAGPCARRGHRGSPCGRRAGGHRLAPAAGGLAGIRTLVMADHVPPPQELMKKRKTRHDRAALADLPA